MSQWPPGPAGTYGASCPSTRMRKRSASTLPSGSSGIPLPWKDTRVHIQLHLFCDQVKRRQPQEQCANCNRLNSSWRFPQQNPIMREGERIWVKPWHCEEATGWGRWLLQVHFWFEELAVSGKVLRQLNDLSFTLVVFVPLNDLIFLMKRARKARRCDSITPETINHWLTHTDWQR